MPVDVRVLWSPYPTPLNAIHVGIYLFTRPEPAFLMLNQSQAIQRQKSKPKQPSKRKGETRK
jgi:hypothetical protein